MDHFEQRRQVILGTLQLLVAEGRSMSWVAHSSVQEPCGLGQPFNSFSPDILYKLIQLTTHSL